MSRSCWQRGFSTESKSNLKMRDNELHHVPYFQTDSIQVNMLRFSDFGPKPDQFIG